MNIWRDLKSGAANEVFPSLGFTVLDVEVVMNCELRLTFIVPIIPTQMYNRRDNLPIKNMF